MKILESEIFSYIDQRLKCASQRSLSELNYLCVKDKEVKIGGKICKENSWDEPLSEGVIFVVEISFKKHLLDTVFTKGLIFNGIDRTILSQEEMWDLGFG
ncbi:hypothetical protein [Shewanella sairae]|nr:hypothetical protein [Shewanella sairae]MCL1132225.1 hypothetical protein [Shewanella sairae]